MLYCYKANLVDTPLHCYGKCQKCRLATDLIYALITIAIPSILMIIFSLMIISNIRHLRRHLPASAIISIVNSSREKELKLRKTDHQLLRMLFLPVILLIIFCISQALQKFYITFQPFGSFSKHQDAVNAFFV
jgi:Na+/melibiose symporter-like transporter